MSKPDFPQQPTDPCHEANKLALVELLARTFGEALNEHCQADVHTLAMAHPLTGQIIISISTDLDIVACGSDQCKGHFQARNVVEAFERNMHNSLNDMFNEVDTFMADTSKEQ